MLGEGEEACVSFLADEMIAYAEEGAEGNVWTWRSYLLAWLSSKIPILLSSHQP